MLCSVRCVCVFCFLGANACASHFFVCCTHRNAASARVLVKAGFTFEGRSRQSVVKDEVILDQLMHSVLCQDVFSDGSSV